jgi:DNA-binding transcriptional ArsR family regulator
MDEVMAGPDFPSEAFKALGDLSRLRVFEFLRGCCCAVAIDETTGEVRPAGGVTVGEVCCAMPIAPATVSQHLKVLREAGLIVTERDGKYIRCGVDPRALSRLAAYFGAADPASRDDDFPSAECGCC